MSSCNFEIICQRKTGRGVGSEVQWLNPSLLTARKEHRETLPPKRLSQMIRRWQRQSRATAMSSAGMKDAKLKASIFACITDEG